MKGNVLKCVESGSVPRFTGIKLRRRMEAGLDVAEIKLLRLDGLDVKPERPD